MYIRNYASGDRWVPGVIDNPIGNKMYAVERPGGIMSERHTDQIRPRIDCPTNNHDVEANVDSQPSSELPESPQLASEPSCQTAATEALPSTPPAVPTRQSTRVRRPPARFQDFTS